MVKRYNLDEKSRLKSQMVEVSEKWSEHKSLAVLYLLESKK